MRIYTGCCKGRGDKVSEDIQHGMIAGVAGGVLCWIGINVLVFADNTAIGAGILLLWFIFMVCGIVHFS